MAGLAGWTKNEGILFLLVVFVVRMIVISSNRGILAYLKELAMFTIGVVPILAVLILFKLKIPSTNELYTGQSIDTVLARLTDFSRYLIIGKSFIVFFYDKLAKEWLIILPIYFFLLGKTKQNANDRKYQNFVFDRAIYVGWLFLYIFDYSTQSTVALKNLYLAFISPNMANYYFFFFSCCINSRGVALKKVHR